MTTLISSVSWEFGYVLLFHKFTLKGSQNFAVEVLLLCSYQLNPEMDRRTHTGPHMPPDTVSPVPLPANRAHEHIGVCYILKRKFKASCHWVVTKIYSNESWMLTLTEVSINKVK